jgi:hypothetical protein
MVDKVSIEFRRSGGCRIDVSHSSEVHEPDEQTGRMYPTTEHSDYSIGELRMMDLLMRLDNDPDARAAVRDLVIALAEWFRGNRDSVITL